MSPNGLGLGEVGELEVQMFNKPLMLNELDRELERKGLKYVRYADDFSIYCKSKYQAQKIGNEIYLFLRDKLKLPINREKSGIRRPLTFTLLGYGFASTMKKGENWSEAEITNTRKNKHYMSKGKYQLVVSDKSWKNLKEKLKTITRKTTPMTFDERIYKLKEVQRGWLQYFRLASIQGKLTALDGWLRNRLRYCIWKN